MRKDRKLTMDYFGNTWKETAVDYITVLSCKVPRENKENHKNSGKQKPWSRFETETSGIRNRSKKKKS
jgi:hypothetical protein